MMKKIYLFLLLFLSTSCSNDSNNNNDPYYFDSSISEEVLKNYLNRAITASEVATGDDFITDGWYPCKDLDIEAIGQIGAKFIGRATFRWHSARHFANPAFFDQARQNIEKIHALDPDIVVQACAFEAIFEHDVNAIPIPAWVLEAYGQPIEDRNFDFDKMKFENDRFADQWGKDSDVPDITRLESQMWFYFQVCSYINIGIEAIHLGQIHLIGAHDPQWLNFKSVIDKIRAYAKSNARRGYVILDAHTPQMGMIVDGVSLLDFNSMPLRPVEVEGEYLWAELISGHGDTLYNRSKGCISPSGWSCESLPYLVEFDNFGISDQPGVADDKIYVWGYDEITWFYSLSAEQKERFLRYAQKWLRESDPQGFLQMPLARVATPADSAPKLVSRAIEKSDEVPAGMGIVKIIAEIWAQYPPIDIK